MKQILTRSTLIMSIPGYFKNKLRAYRCCRWWKLSPHELQKEILFNNGKKKIDKDLDIRHMS